MKDSTYNVKAITRFKMPEESPGYLLWRVSMQWRTAIEEVLRPLDLTHPQFVILAVTAWLTHGGDLISQIAVSKATSLDPNTTSQILKSLEAKGFIKRVRSVNERTKNPMLTALGKKRLALAMPAVEEADEMFFKVLKSKQTSALLDSLLTLLQRHE